MSQFELRAKEIQLSEKDLALTYHHVSRLMQGGIESPLRLDQRLRLAEQVLHQALYPEKIEQGHSPTGNVATIENRIFVRQAHKLAQLIADVATKGKYTTADGTVVDLTHVPGALEPNTEAQAALASKLDIDKLTDIKIDGKRTWVGQICELIAINIAWAENPSLHMGPRDVLMYVKPQGGDQEQLAKYSLASDGTLHTEIIANSRKLSIADLIKIHNAIAGTNETGFAIVGPGSPAGDDYLQADNLIALDIILQDMKEQQVFPALLQVWMPNWPFDQIEGNVAGRIINIQSVRWDNETGQMLVEFISQLGEASNHLGQLAVPSSELFAAMAAASV